MNRRTLTRAAVAASILMASPSMAGGDPLSPDHVPDENISIIGMMAERIAISMEAHELTPWKPNPVVYTGSVAVPGVVAPATTAVTVKYDDDDETTLIVAGAIAAAGLGYLMFNGDGGPTHAPGWGHDGEYKSGPGHYKEL